MSERDLDFAHDARCGMCGAKGTIHVWYVPGDETGRLRDITAVFSCGCDQAWLREGRSPFFGISDRVDREASG